MAIFEASVLAALLAGRAAAQCVPFDLEVNGGESLACTLDGNTAATDDDAALDTVCTYDCAGATLPQASGIEYTCSQSIDTECAYVWTPSVEGGQVCSEAVTCPDFLETASGLAGQSEFACTDSSNAAVGQDATDLGTVCSIDACQDGFTLSTEPDDLSFTCTADEEGVTSAGSWVQTNDGADVCTPDIPVTCAAVNTAEGVGETLPVAGTEWVCSTNGVFTATDAALNLGDECRLRCTNNDEGITTDSEPYICAVDQDDASQSVWTPPGVATSCGAVTCVPLEEELAGVASTELSGACVSQNVDDTCDIQCVDNTYELFNPDESSFTCTRDDNGGEDDIAIATAVGTWVGDVCVPAIQCPALVPADFSAASVQVLNRQQVPTAELTGRFGYTAVLTCDENESVVGDVPLECQSTDAGNQWVGTHECVPDCPSRNDVDDGFVVDDATVVCSADGDTIPEDEGAPSGTVCGVVCNTGRGFRDVSVQTVTCDSGVWSAAPFCDVVECSALEDDEADVLLAACNRDGGDECTFDGNGDVANGASVTCEVQACEGTLELAELGALYTCTQEGLSAAGTWQPVGDAYVCNEACSEAALLVDAVYDPTCCADRDGGCLESFAGCNSTDECVGELVCGDAGASCSEGINALSVNMTRCCVAEPMTNATNTTNTPDGTAPPSASGATDVFEGRVATTIAVAVVAAVSFVFV